MRKIPLLLTCILFFSFVSFGQNTPSSLLNNNVSASSNDELDEFVTVTGVITSIDTPENAVEGITVTINTTAGELVGSGVTAADGSYSIGDGDVETGTYDFVISFDPVGTNGYHDITHEDVVIPNDGIVNLDVFEILAPANVRTSGFNTMVTLTWELPANDVEVSLNMIERLRSIVTSATGEKLAYYSNKLAYLEKIFKTQQNGTDDLSDLTGFIITDGEGNVLETTDANTFSFSFEDLVNGGQYQYAVAADYGYGDNYLVFSDVVTGTPIETAYTITATTYEWFDVRADANVVTPELADDGEVWVDFTETFELFGMTYSGITIGSNGAMSFLEDVQIGYQPVVLPSTEAPGAMVCPFWIDLDPSGSDDHDAFYTFDADGNLWIEWYSIYYDATETANFEAMLDFDNNTILFQYNTADIWGAAAIGLQDEAGEIGYMYDFNNIEDGHAVIVEPELLTYGSVDGYVEDTDGAALAAVEVYFDGEVFATTDVDGYYSFPLVAGDSDLTFVLTDYSPVTVTATVVADQNTTLDDVILTQWGSIEGDVVDSDGNAIADAEVAYDGMVLTTTDANGAYSAEMTVPAGDYEINYSHDDYWPETVTATLVLGAATEMDDVVLTAPGEFDISPTSVEIQIDITPENPQYTGSVSFDLENDGSGPIVWDASIEILDVPDHWGASLANNPDPSDNRIERAFSRGEFGEASPLGPVENATWNSTDDLWDLLEGWDTEDTQGGVGAVVTSDRVYTCEWGFENNFGFFRYDHDGNLISSETFPTALQGVRDMAWDGTWLYGGNANANGTIYKFNPDDLSDYELLGTAAGLGRGVAYDPETGDIYTTNWSGIGKLENVGGVYNFQAMTYPTDAASCYGVAWMPADPDGKNIWLYCQPASNAVVFRMDPDSGEIDAGYEVYAGDIGMAGGIDISDDYDSGMWNIATNVQATPDHIDIWEGYQAGVPWLFVEPDNGTINAGETGQVSISYNVEDHELLAYALDGDEIEAGMTFSGAHWTGGEVPVLITFVNSADEFDSKLPMEYALHQNYPNPFNPATTIKFDLVETQNVKISVFNVLGQQVAQVVNTRMQAGYHTVTFDASTLSSGVYFYRLEADVFTSMKKMVLVK